MTISDFTDEQVREVRDKILLPNLYQLRKEFKELAGLSSVQNLITTSFEVSSVEALQLGLLLGWLMREFAIQEEAKRLREFKELIELERLNKL